MNSVVEERLTVMGRLLRPWMEWWHGRKDAPHQHLYYRCRGCRQVVTWNTIHKGGCSCDMARELVPARLSFTEELRIVMAPWTL